MNKIIKGLTLTTIVLGLSISCGKKEQKVTEPAPKPKTVQELLNEKLSPNYTNVKDGFINYQVTSTNHLWEIVRTYSNHYYQVVHKRNATPGEVDSKVVETIRLNQDLAKKYENLNETNFFGGFEDENLLIIPNHIETGDVVKIKPYLISSNGGGIIIDL